MTVQIIPRKIRPHTAASWDVCAAGFNEVYNFPTRKLAKEFCIACGFDIYRERKFNAGESECRIYSPYVKTTSAIEREFGPKSYHYVHRSREWIKNKFGV